MELPVKKIPPKKDRIGGLLLYGQPKVGKTTILSQLENNLIIDLEKGSDYVEALKVQVNSLKELHEVCKAIKDKGKPYKYVSIDTITKLEEWCEEEATKKYKQSIIGKNFVGDSVLELPRGAGYLHLRLEFKKWLDIVKEAADNIIFVGHIRDKSIDIGGKEVSANDIDLTGKIRQIICAYYADSVGYLYRKNGELWVTFKTKDSVTCGSRIPHLAGQEFRFNWDLIYTS